MATALANRASSIGYTARLFRFPYNFISSFSTSTSSSSPAAADGAKPTKPRRKKKKNLFEVAQFLPNWGIGYHMAKTHWTNVSYEITKLNLYKDGRHGKAWGIAYKDENLVLHFGRFLFGVIKNPSSGAECYWAQRRTSRRFRDTFHGLAWRLHFIVYGWIETKSSALTKA